MDALFHVTYGCTGCGEVGYDINNVGRLEL